LILPDVGAAFSICRSFPPRWFSTLARRIFFRPAEFTITGIDLSADLDPADTSAFVTGLTFVSDGPFTRTMTPITEVVSTVAEPTSLALLTPSLLLLALLDRRKRELARLERDTATGAIS